MDHKLLRLNTGHLRRVAVFGIGAGLIGAALVGCTGSSSGKASASASPSSRSTIRTLPSLPAVPQNIVVIRQTHDAGHYTSHSVALTSRALTVRFACAGRDGSAVSLKLFQVGAKPIYRIDHQPCDGTVQKIALTANTTTALKTDVDAPKGSKYGLLITQG